MLEATRSMASEDVTAGLTRISNDHPLARRYPGHFRDATDGPPSQADYRYSPDCRTSVREKQGIGAAIKLREAGVSAYLVIEAGDGVGGAWHWNTYPGIGVDIPSFSYQFSFEKRSDWSRETARTRPITRRGRPMCCSPSVCASTTARRARGYRASRSRYRPRS